MLKHKLIQWGVLLGLFLGMVLTVQAQDDGKAYVVLLYSPTCPHCHKLITEDLPPIQEQFGELLSILYVDVTTQAGNYIAQSAYQFYNIPMEEWVVPMVIVGDEVLIGGAEIPARLPEIVQTGLANGGINVPSFPAMQSTFEAWQAKQQSEAITASTETTSNLSTQDTLLSRMADNLMANGLAIAILLVLILSALWFVIMRHDEQSPLVPRVMIIAASLMMLVLAMSVLFGKQQDNLSASIMSLTIVCTVLAGGFALFGNRNGLAIVFSTVTGLGIAAYLTYIETSAQPAVCGLVGDCNAVQQSPYAFIAGIPVGLLGLIAYSVMLVLGLLITFNKNPFNINLQSLFNSLLWTSIIFTIYLTFLEPFVIGSSCTWCLLSALLVVNLMWMVLPIIEEEEIEEESSIRAYQHI